MKIKTAFAVIICVILFIPLIGLFAGKGDDEGQFVIRENRQKNKLEYQSLKLLPKTIEDWFNDNYGFRYKLIKENKKFMRNYFGVNDSDDKCIIGKNGYLFLGNSYSRVIDQYTNSLFFTDENISAIVANIARFKEAAESVGAQFYLIIPPTKSTVYAENMPDNIIKKDNRNLYDAVFNRLKNEGFNITDIKSFFASQMPDVKDKLYYKTDTHWSSYGAYLAFMELQKMMAVLNPDMIQMPDRTFEEKANQRTMDLIGACGVDRKQFPDFEYLSKPFDFTEITDENGAKAALDKHKNEYAAYINTTALNKKTVTVFRDSFFTALLPYTLQTFENVSVTHYDDILLNKTDLNAFISEKKPDIVILELVERELSKLF